MSALNDPRYMQLYRDYSKAIQAYDIALAKRKRFRAQLANKASAASQSNQQPTGSPVASSPSQAPSGGAAAPHSETSVVKVYMGPILGWAKLTGTSPEYPGANEPEPAFDAGPAYDAMSLKFYWDAKIHYEKCRRAFFDYVRRQNVEVHRQQARGELDHSANLQMLGHGGENALVGAQREMEGACRNAWGLYQSSPTPKSQAIKVLLCENLADAQFVGLESPTTHSMHQEIMRLVNSGEAKQEK